ncbi:ABC transporter permease subunit [Rhodoferax saidenbachensis]|uniref:Spermidine/putrescine transport system permease protein n=1 Tax=Rhodoferax saidenbachensis TaxID=1484693 RepID=A0ABU1ZMT0_9BURK|nr:ABC transporter permease subunit [Rhodoferax saidenbachensis]MDR7306857.1 putative spermidine/putrescine transport system permease protein [Rhodoferax saidenbachensis]
MPVAPPATQAPPAVSAQPASFNLLGVLPFMLFALLFLILPTGYLMVGAFQDAEGHFTLANLRGLMEPNVLEAYWISFKISAASALGGGLLGFVLAWAAVMGKLPAWIRPTLMTFSGVASNFAGVPLAFAFLSTLGRMGLVTVLLRTYLDVNLYASGFSILSFAGLAITYLYFQIPLMVLIVTPALEGLKKEWREACDCLGGTAFHYWRYVALPVLWPSMVGAMLLLFANAFGAVATAYALTGSSLNIVPILLYAQIRGDVLHNPNLGYAMALGMIVITGLANAGYMVLRSKTERSRV